MAILNKPLKAILKMKTKIVRLIQTNRQYLKLLNRQQLIYTFLIF